MIRPTCASFCILLGLSAVAFAQGAAADKAKPAGPPPGPVVVAAVVEQVVHSGQTFVGTVVPEQRAVIGSAVDGRVVEFPVNEGDRVEAGQTLAQLLTDTIRLELEAAQGELRLRQAELDELENGSRPEEIAEARALTSAAQSELKLALRRLERIQRLYQNGAAATEDQLDEASAGAENARAVLEQRQANYQLALAGPRQEKILQAKARVAMQHAVVERLSDQLIKHTIISRFPGYVTVEHTEIGQWVNRGDPVAEVVGIDRVDVLAYVLESHVPYIHMGQVARVEVPSLPDRVFTGEVIVVVPEGDQRSRTFPVKVRLANQFEGQKPLLNAGMLARVTLPTGPEKTAKLVPKDAVVLGGQQPMVFVVSGDAKIGSTAPVRPVPVTLGIASGSAIEVNGDLARGDRVVVLGNERLMPGQMVIVASERPIAGSAGSPAAHRE